MTIYIALRDLCLALEKWLNLCVQERTTITTQRDWAVNTLGFSSAINDTNVRAFIDRSVLNGKFIPAFMNTDPTSRVTTVHSKVELSALYSFQKCLSVRCSTRLNLYNDDLSHKYGRIMNNVGLGYYKYNAVKTHSG